MNFRTLPITPLKIEPIPFDLVIQLRSRPTIAAAATMTSAYSAVDWPSRRTCGERVVEQLVVKDADEHGQDAVEHR